MAGFYVDVPSRRMAPDADGTVGLDIDNGFPSGAGIATELTQTVMTGMTREAVGSPAGPFVANGGGRMVAFVFPELRELDGWYVSADDGGTWGNPIHSSGDTTSGNDGTWTSRGSAPGIVNALLDAYRTGIISLAVSNVRGVRVKPTGLSAGGGTMDRLHLYGEISAGETPDRLLWIDNDDDLEYSKPVDYGDAPRGSAEDHVTYLKNNSTTLAANSVQVTAEDLFGGSGSWYTFDDGTGFSATKALASSISNGANSPNITIRRIIPDAEAPQIHAARAFVAVGSWT